LRSIECWAIKFADIGVAAAAGSKNRGAECNMSSCFAWILSHGFLELGLQCQIADGLDANAGGIAWQVREGNVFDFDVGDRLGSAPASIALAVASALAWPSASARERFSSEKTRS